MKKAVIVGCRGQDGRLLRELLLQKGYGVIGLHSQGVWTDGLAYGDGVDVGNRIRWTGLLVPSATRNILFGGGPQSSQDAPAADNVAVPRQHPGQYAWRREFLEGIRSASPGTGCSMPLIEDIWKRAVRYPG